MPQPSGLATGLYPTATPTLSGGQAAPLRLDQNGALVVDIGSSTVTATIGGSLGISSMPGQGAATPAASPTQMNLSGARYDATPGTRTSGQAGALQTDSVGNLLVNVQVGGGGGGSTTITAATITGGSVTALPSGTTTVTGTVSVAGGGLAGTVTVGSAVTPYALPASMLRGAGATTTNGAVTLIGAQGAGNKIYVTGAQVWNSGTTSTTLAFNDGSSWTILATAGVSGSFEFETPLVVNANTALTFTPASGVTSIGVNVQGYVGP